MLAAGCLLAATAHLAAAQEYEIGPADVLNVIVLGQAPMTGEMTVGADGMLSFPFLGRVKASGLSPTELERKLITLLSDGYLKRPQVSVTVKQYKSHRVFVTGEVAKPGPYGLRPDRSLLTLLQDVGDLTPDVGHEVIVIRAAAPETWSPAPAEPTPVGAAGEEGGNGGGGEEAGEEAAAAPQPPAPRPGPPFPGEVPGSQIFRLNLRDIRSGYPDKDMALEVGDTVYLPKAAQFYVSGHVARPGAYRYEEGLTVFRALALAGHPTDRGSNKVKIVRLEDGKRREFRPKLTDPVLPEDTLHVPEKFF
ncbi:MAG TPA: polysaccharide biosynthesis/export family protein [Vicinamibacteria bacterium]|nr:polysaccharide biosynthesis/export family protein [Vicinamibacteria bacterium]